MSAAAIVPVLAAGILAASIATTASGLPADMHAGGLARKQTLSYLALGDSYTIGEGVAPAGRWPMQLADALRERGIAIEDPRIIARTGWTTDELSAAIDAEFGGESAGGVAGDTATVAPPHFGFVTLLIGVNNQYRERSADEYAVQFEALLERATSFADGRRDRVLVLSIPDWGVTPFAAQSGRDTARIARELDAFNATAARLCAARGIAFVDIAPISRARGAEPAMLTDDGLHPSSAMYSEWTADALPVALRLLRAPAR
jgi:lysophospholipase L1-like esterase